MHLREAMNIKTLFSTINDNNVLSNFHKHYVAPTFPVFNNESYKVPLISMSQINKVQCELLTLLIVRRTSNHRRNEV